MKEQKKSRPLEIVEKQRALVAEKIIEDMKRDGFHWSEPYIPSFSPHNPVSGTVYQGGNRLRLGFVGYMRGPTDNRWCAFNQIRDSGWRLKKGTKAALIEKRHGFSIEEENENTDEKEVTGCYLRCVGYRNVFDTNEIEGIPAPPISEHVSDHAAAIAGDLTLSSCCPIVESMRYQGSAGYVPGSDRILIVSRKTFLSNETFTRVSPHEMAHSTGHPSALNRSCNTNFGDPKYAQEELVAKLGSLFFPVDLGIQSADYEGEHYESHVPYLQSWVHALEGDPPYLFRATAKADKVGTFIIGHYNDVSEKYHDRDVERAPEEVSLKGEFKAMKSAAKSYDEQAKVLEIAVAAR